MTKLQLGLDGELATALEILQAVHAFIDISEIGTPLVFREGMQALRQIRSSYANLCLIADLKIMDAGEAEADIAFGTGADRVTVMAMASDATIQGALRSARFHQGQIMIDMMQVEKPLERALELIQLGCDLLCLHTAHDLQSRHDSPWRLLAELRQALPTLQLAIAGGVKLDSLPQILPHQPQVIIVGSAITAAADPLRAAQQFHERIQEYGNR